MALSMAESIASVMQAESLTAAEKTQLTNVLAEIVGNADLAKAYVDSKGRVGDNKDNESKKFDIKKIAPQLKTDKDTAYFWSGNTNGKGGKDFAMQYAIKNGGTTLERLMDIKGIKMPIWDISNPDAIKAWDDASAEYARQASGEVRAIIGTNIRLNSTWEGIELPTLKSNKEVTRIIVIDPETLIETVVFTRR